MEKKIRLWRRGDAFVLAPLLLGPADEDVTTACPVQGVDGLTARVLAASRVEESFMS